jgi:putative transposase
MGKSYHIELRERVIGYINSGRSIKEASKIFKVSEDAIQRWKKLSANGNLASKKVGGNNRKISEVRLQEYIETNPDKTQYEVAKHFNVTQTGICRALKRMKITRKKNDTLYRKRRRQKKIIQRNY